MIWIESLKRVGQKRNDGYDRCTKTPSLKHHFKTYSTFKKI